jgi:hypothetical protein
MSPHLSLFFQPLDIALFNPLKRCYNRLVGELMRTSLTRISKEDFLPTFKDAFFQVFKQKNIQSGFRDAGFVLYNPEEVIARLDVKLRTPTPDIESLILPEPWVSQTPHNPTEIHSQFIFLKNRISRHQESSPTSILGAINHFEKEAKMIMHKFALQEAELKILRNTNRELTNRRKTKKKQLRKGGLLSFQNAKNLQDAQDVNAQIRQKMRESHGPKKRQETRARRCTRCGKTGHNIRTCDINLESSEEENSD